jgi:nucleoside-diphosphate kinase
MGKIERTLVLLKPDAVERGLVGEIISRFEKVGLRIIGMKKVLPSDELASDHYGDLDIRHGVEIKKNMVGMMTSGPVIAMVLEGIGAILQVRKMVGSTYPNEALPGTIRGDYAHISKEYANANSVAVKNLVHASSDEQDANRELKLWFSEQELFEYEPVHEKHTRG